VGLDAQEMEQFKPSLVYLDENNQVVRTDDAIPTQAA
jgi:aspartate 1-decarboxylase